MFKICDKVEFLSGFQDAGDESFTYVVIVDEEKVECTYPLLISSPSIRSSPTGFGLPPLTPDPKTTD